MPDDLYPSADRYPSADPRNLWQGQEVEKILLTAAEIRTRATHFERRVHRRNLREYVAGAVVIVLFSMQLGRVQGWRLAPALLSILATIYVMFQLHRRASARPLPADAGLKTSIEFHRGELERQRDAARGVWRWYLLPFLPGAVAVLFVAGIDRGINARLIASGAFSLLVFVGICALNEKGARRLDSKIKELKAMETENA
ncbi:MAG TPA: hypothetical protein VGN17_23320 [Bryobacteraceae bacterium]|jgi:hypothetical protein